MIIVPALSYTLGYVLLTEVDAIRQAVFRAAPGLLGTITIPPLLLKIRSLNFLWSLMYKQQDLGGILVVGSIVLIFLSGLISMIYAFAYRAVAPPRYGPTDAPPQKRRGKRKKYTR